MLSVNPDLLSNVTPPSSAILSGLVASEDIFSEFASLDKPPLFWDTLFSFLYRVKEARSDWVDSGFFPGQEEKPNTRSNATSVIFPPEFNDPSMLLRARIDGETGNDNPVFTGPWMVPGIKANGVAGAILCPHAKKVLSFFHVPVSAKDINFGYCFLAFRNADLASRFKELAEGRR